MDFVALLNQERASRGLKTLDVDPVLQKMAKSKTGQIISTGQFSHTIGGMDERDLGNSFGYPGDAKLDEVLCWSESRAKDALKSFMGSPVHRQVLLDPSYRVIGLDGPVDGGRFWGLWVVMLGSKKSVESVQDKPNTDGDKPADNNNEKPKEQVLVVKSPVVTSLAAGGAVTRKTPFRNIGPVSLDKFRSVLVNAQSPMSPVEELYRIADKDSALFLVQAVRESSLGTSALAQRTKNPLGLKLPDNSDFCTYGCWATAVAEWRLRLRDPGYKNGVYYSASHGGVDLSLEDFLTIYVGGPGCLSSGMSVCANGETRESINRYIDATVADLNKYLGTVVEPDPDPGGGIVFGRVPNPNIVNKIIPGSVGGGAWVAVGNNSAWDNLGTRVFRGFCLHIMEGSLDGTDSYFRNDARMRALTDFGIGWSNARNAYSIYQWNSMVSNRAPWASGPASDPEGDGPAFIQAYGVNAINRDLRSIELAGYAGSVLPSEIIDNAVNLMAYLADQAKVPWSEWPFKNGLPLIYGHFEFGPKVCPGSWVIAQIDSMSKRVGDLLKKYQTGA